MMLARAAAPARKISPMDAMQVVLYLVIAAVTLVMTLLLLLITKIPAVVTIGAAFISAALTLLYARIDLGYWDPFAPIAFVATMLFTFVVSFAFLGLGRWRRWPFFLGKADRK